MMIYNSEADFRRRGKIDVTLWLSSERGTINFECPKDSIIWDDEVCQIFCAAIQHFEPRFGCVEDAGWVSLGISAAHSKLALTAANSSLEAHGFRTNILTDAVEAAGRRTH
jgi:hypothetical protein